MSDTVSIIATVTIAIIVSGIFIIAIYKWGRKDEYDEWIIGTKSNDDEGGSDTDTSEAWKNTK